MPCLICRRSGSSSFQGPNNSLSSPLRRSSCLFSWILMLLAKGSPLSLPGSIFGLLDAGRRDLHLRPPSIPYLLAPDQLLSFVDLQPSNRLLSRLGLDAELLPTTTTAPATPCQPRPPNHRPFSRQLNRRVPGAAKLNGGAQIGQNQTKNKERIMDSHLRLEQKCEGRSLVDWSFSKLSCCPFFFREI
ncbi:hypothetical protein KFK09_003421 [Dendrobium nobile]|uniref:Uncharacterized protein n=1 Tax=Dendrobium nobile TaxID=94219 RepID=A0A8T3C301_DENNO|nr:hypothetical protein KFK09_003421 [Dendrobium nobile]